jgi:hypothetical protein
MNQFGLIHIHIDMYIYGNVTIPGIAILNKQKFNSFFFYKIREQEGGAGSAWGCWYQCGGEEVGIGHVNIVHILCAHVCKWKK